MSIVIEKNVPLPTNTVKAKYPFEAMEVGDSFFVDRKPATLYGAARRAAVRLTRKFAVREAEGGSRVWRTE